MGLRRSHHLVLVVLMLSVAATAAAQERVTILLRNGERVSGRFEDWNRQTGVVYVRVTPSNQVTLPMRDVLVIDVGGNGTNFPESEVQAAAGADHILVTRRREVIAGRLANIEGGEGSSSPDEPRTVTFMSGNERRMGMADVARIYLGRFPQRTDAPPPGQGSAPSPTTPFTLRVRVPGNQQWTPTNILLRPGDTVQFSVRGQVQLSADPEDMAVAAGSLRGRRAARSPAPEFLAGALLGRVGRGLFPIGDQTEPLQIPGAGALFLGINDDVVEDNQGALDVSIRVIPGRR
jgi:hypothetical protein